MKENHSPPESKVGQNDRNSMHNAQCRMLKFSYCVLCILHCALQEELPITYIYPPVELAADLTKMSNFFEAEFLVEF